MKSKLKILVPLLLVVASGATYKLVLAKPEPAAHAPRVDGMPYVLQRSFLVNLERGRYAQLTVALVLPHSFMIEMSAMEEEEEVEPPEGFGMLGQEGVVRSVVTDTLTGTTARRLLRRSSRAALIRRIERRIADETDVEAEDVVITDVTVQ